MISRDAALNALLTLLLFLPVHFLADRSPVRRSIPFLSAGCSSSRPDPASTFCDHRGICTIANSLDGNSV